MEEARSAVRASGPTLATVDDGALRLATLVRGARLAARLTQNELAERVGVTQSRISQVERPRRSNHAPSASLGRSLADALDLDFAEFGFVACACGACPELVLAEGFAAGHEKRGDAWPADFAEQAAAIYTSDAPTLHATADRLGCTHTTVRRYLTESGVELHPPGPRRRYPQPEPRRCQRAGCNVVFTPQASHLVRGRGNYHSKTCAALGLLYEELRGPAWLFKRLSDPEKIRKLKPGSIRKKLLCRIAGSKEPSPGGGPRGRPRAKLESPERLERLKWHAARGHGRNTVAREFGIKASEARSLLEQLRDGLL